MKKLAVCVATIGHPDVVRDVLQQCVQDYYEYGIDIYYYDSSEDDQTKKVVEEFLVQGYDNLHYLHVDLDIEDKIIAILGGEGLEEKYEYLWPTKDRSFCPPATLEKVMQAMGEKYDLIMLGAMGRGGMESQTYETGEEFYRDWAWLATSLDTLIYNYDTMLDPGVWKEDIPRTDYTPSWRVYATVFNRLAKMQTKRVRVLADQSVQLINSALGASIKYKHKFFTTWKDHWIQVNEDLPECYGPYRENVIKKVASLPWIFGGVTRLKELHQLGELTEETILAVEKDWEKVSDFPVEYLRRIALGDEKEHYSVFLLESTGNSTADVLIEMYKMLIEGRLNKDQIPIQDIMQCVLGIYSAQKGDRSGRRDVFAESVKDILQYMAADDTSPEEVCGCLQVLINFILLMT